jgi:ribosomal protein S18 acetylase RimI-like enzyme
MTAHIRMANSDDIELLVTTRLDYLATDGYVMSGERRNEFSAQLRDYFAIHLERNDFAAVLADDMGRIASVAYLILSERPSAPAFPNGRIGTVMNVLTYPEYRRRGFATRVMQRLLAAAQDMKLASVDLMATADGKDLYAKLGFAASEYTPMRRIL